MQPIRFSCWLMLISLSLLSAFAPAQPVQLTFSDTNEYHPKFSPDGLTIALTKRSDDNWIDICTMPAEGGFPVPLDIGKEGDHAFCWSPDGTQMVFDAYKPQGPPSDLYILTLATGDIVTLADDNQSENHPTWSPDGTTIVFASGPNLFKIPASGGTPEFLTSDYNEDYHPAFSPDGTEILFTSMRSGNCDLWRIPLSGGTATQVTTDPGYDDRGCWSPDGKSIAFVSNRNGFNDIYIQNLSTGVTEQITFSPSYDSHPDWSPDGTKIVFASTRSGNYDIWVVDLTTTGIGTPDAEEDHGFRAFPNPASGKVLFDFSMEVAQKAQLNIVDGSGRAVRTLADNFRQTGKHQIMWDGTNQSNEKVQPGIYYAILRIEKSVNTLKIIRI